MTLGSMKMVVRRIWDATPMPYTVIVRVNALGKGQPNDIDLLYLKKRPIGELEITGVDDGEAESPQVKLIELDTNLNPISAGAETLK